MNSNEWLRQPHNSYHGEERLFLLRGIDVWIADSLIWLTLGAFAIGTEGFMIAGLLPALARDLNVGLSAAGHLVTAFSLAYAIGAPVMAVLTAGLERRRLLAIAMAGFTLANLLAALAPGYAGLLAARLLLALSAASFMPAASGYAAASGGPERRGRALSMVTNGLTLAIVAGVPLGRAGGEGFGWRATFLGVAGLAALSLLGILARLPRQPPSVTAESGRAPGAGQARRYAGGAGDQRADRGRHLHGLHLSRRFPGRRRRAWPAGAGAGAAGLRPGECGRHSARRHRGGPLGRAPHRDRWGGLALLAYLVLSLGAALGPARAMPVLLPAILLWGLASWGRDDGAAGAAGRAGSGPGARQPLAELLGHLSRQRDGRGSGRAGHRRWRSGAARLGGGGVQPSRAAGGTDEFESVASI